jgi:predicted nucleotide-binding protein (sugar kinase/HSP70/actin superfamily)
MNISVPKCGSIPYIAREMCNRLDVGYVEAPDYSERTVEIGVSISPEHICFPCKVLIGSAVETLEMGADTLITLAGFGPCRFNYFAEIQRRVLEREGYLFKIITFDGPRDAPLEFYRNTRSVLAHARMGFASAIKELALTLKKARIYDEIDKSELALRGLENEEGATDRAAEDARAILESARTAGEIREARRAVSERFAAVPVDAARPHLKIGLVGELLTCLEPYFNFDAARWLGRRGVIVERSLHISDIFTPFGRNPVLGCDAEEIERAAAPFLCHEVGGHGQISVGATVLFARRGFDAVVHFLPFTCLPEVIAKTVFVRISSELNLPILSMSVDEQTARTGVQTRMEALLDLAWSNKHDRDTAADLVAARNQEGHRVEREVVSNRHGC